MEKKKTKRSRIKYSALDPTVNLKTRYELIADYDYLDKLSEQEKAWLNKFTKEYVNADLDSKKASRNLHRTKELKKDCYDRNNARNRCIWTKCKASGNFVSIDEVPKKVIENENYEEVLVQKIDLRRKKLL
jgi:hypothetical protein